MEDMERHPPGPAGPGASIENLRRIREDYGGFLRELVATYGDVIYFPVGEQRVCLLNDPSCIKQVFTESHSFPKPEALKASNRGYWGDGLTTLEGDEWQKRRRLLQPLFDRDAIAELAPAIVECTRDLMAGWGAEAIVQVPQALLGLVTRIAARTTLDADVAEGAASGCPHAARAGVLPTREARAVQFVVPILQGEGGVVPIVRPRAARRMPYTTELIERRMASRDERGDMLSVLLREVDRRGCPLSAREVLDETMQLLFAGHLNTPRALEAILFALAEQPDVERKLLAELDEVLAGRSPRAEDLAGMPYGAMVIKEAMRVHTPSGPSLQREVIETVEVGRYNLDPGTLIWVDCHLMHHDARYFEQPERFWPERFSKERAHLIPKYAFLPFGAGPRTCIGNAFAMMEMQLIVTVVLQAYEVRLASGPHERTLRVKSR
jgi:cytochrome P450